MNDIVLTGKTENPNSFIEQMEETIGNDALMILKRVPEKWLSDEECDQSIQFVKYAKTDFTLWSKGRIFDSEKELKWTKINEKFHLVYTGPPLATTELSLVNTENWDTSKPVQYFLWGTPLKRKELKTSDPVYLELQIPKLLYYPFSSKGRPHLNVVEYIDQTSGQIVHYRFAAKGVEHESV